MNAKRIQLLPQVEVEELYSRPVFTEFERWQYFSLTPQELVSFSTFRNVKTRLIFALQVGYFRAKQQFFDFNIEDVHDDVEFILNKYFSGTRVYPSLPKGTMHYESMNKQHKLILSLFQYNPWSLSIKSVVQEQVAQLLKLYPKIHSAYRQLLIFFENKQIVIPSYRFFQDVFTAGIADEEVRINSILRDIPVNITKLLNKLNSKSDGITAVNIIRSDQKSFRYTDIRFELDKVKQIQELYDFSQAFIPRLGISNNAIQHYAEIADQYAASRLRRFSRPQQHLHILCFVNNRYQQLMDNLLTSFIYHMKAIKASAKIYASMLQLSQASKYKADLPKLAQFLKWFPQRDLQLNQTEIDEFAYQILPKEQFTILANYLEGKAFDKKAAIWEYYAKSSRKVALYLRPIFTCINWGYYKNEGYLLQLMELLKTYCSNGKVISKLKITDEIGITIPKSMLRHLKRTPDDTDIDPYLFEWFVYLKVEHELSRWRLFCNDSLEYRDIEKNLIDDALVDDVATIANELGYPSIVDYCGVRLDSALATLQQTWNRTISNVEQNNNTGIKVKTAKDGTEYWHLLYDSKMPLDDKFFNHLPKLDIANIVMFIGDKLGLWDTFAHIRERYVKRKQPVPLYLTACLISEAFGFGTKNMAEVSDIDFNQLRSTKEDFLRVDTLCSANDIACNFIHSLPLFRKWDLIEDKVLADADGQKFSTSDNTIQSRYSRKYLGKGRGISIYTLIANFVAVNAKNIGLNEYEGHMLYDMIYGNNTDIDINMVTGDNHSLNKLNFVVLVLRPAAI